MIAALIIMLPEYKLPALIFRAPVDTDGICDALSERTAKELVRESKMGAWDLKTPDSGMPACSNNPRFA